MNNFELGKSSAYYAYDAMVYSLNGIRSDLSEYLQEGEDMVKAIKAKNLLAKLEMQIEMFNRFKNNEDRKCITQKLSLYA